jgi:sugar lactone lactonase YvrE
MKHNRNTAFVLILIVMLVSVVMFSGCGSALKPTKIAVNLPEKYNTPDGMVVDADNNILLNVPNFANDKFPAVVLKIDENDAITEVTTLPRHPVTGKCAPLGIDIGTDGNLYIADNQGFVGRKDNQSRIIRVNMKDGKAVSTEVIVKGIMQANAVVCTKDSIYVTDTNMATVDGITISGVWRFKYSEYTGIPINVPPYNTSGGVQDSHLVTTLETQDKEWWGTVGANGLAFAADGTMYVCNFGEASVVEVKLDASGKVVSQKTLAQGNGIKSADGMKIHPVTGDIYIADFIGNAVHKVDPKTGKVTTIATNENNSGGVGGKLDKPSEVCFRGNKLYVANIDLTLDGNEHDAPHTISVIEMD